MHAHDQEVAMNFWIGKEWFAGWGTLALINAGLAQSKHRGGLAWFFLSVFLGPIATLLLLFLEDPDNRARG
jgi:hypothetical protein